MSKKRQARQKGRKRIQAAAANKADNDVSIRKASRLKEHSHRWTMAVSIPAIMAASATGASNAVINFVQQTSENVVSSLSHLVTRDVPDQHEAAGGQYYFSSAWKGFADRSQKSADEMAAAVVRIAAAKARVELTPELSRRYIQWVFAGNINPEQASDILVQDNNPQAESGLIDLTRLLSMHAETNPATSADEFTTTIAPGRDYYSRQSDATTDPWGAANSLHNAGDQPGYVTRQLSDAGTQLSNASGQLSDAQKAALWDYYRGQSDSQLSDAQKAMLDALDALLHGHPGDPKWRDLPDDPTQI